MQVRNIRDTSMVVRHVVLSQLGLHEVNLKYISANIKTGPRLREDFWVAFNLRKDISVIKHVS